MAEPTLAINYGYLKDEIARQWGKTRGFAALTADEQLTIVRAIQTGYRWFLYPPPLDPNEPSHHWSFLMVAGNGFGPDGTDAIALHIHQMPDDFGSLVGDFNSFTPQGIARIPLITVERLLALRGADIIIRQGFPEYAALRSLKVVGSSNQKWEVLFYPEPTPPTVYPVVYRYNYVPPALLNDSDVPAGGPMHHETLLLACMAAIERFEEDDQGVRWQAFLDRLRASVKLDRDAAKPTAEDHYASSLVSAPNITLDVTLKDLRRQVGLVLGYGADVLAWDHFQKKNADYIVDQGVRHVYQAHNWTFLLVDQTITLSPGVNQAQFSTDFGAQIEEFNFLSPGTGRLRIPIIAGMHLDALIANNPAQAPGLPRFATIQAQQGSPGARQQWEATFFPQPDQDYVLTFTGNIQPAKLISDTDQPLGGVFHAETFLTSCLAFAELYKTGTPGGWQAKFEQCLQRSKDHDAKTGGREGVAFAVASLAVDLGLKWHDFMREVGGSLGYGYDVTAYSHKEREESDYLVQSGYRQMLYPPPIEDGQTAHVWSFLKPITTLTVFPPISPDIAESQGLTISATVLQGPNTLLTLSSAVAKADWVGKKLVTQRTNSSVYDILTLVSTTQIVVAGDATAESGQVYGVQLNPIKVFPNTPVVNQANLQSPEGSFYSSMDGMTIDIYAGSYKILKFANANFVTIDMNFDDLVTTWTTWALTKFASDYGLTADVSGIDGDLTFNSSQIGWSNVPVTSEWIIRSLRQRGVASGHPKFAALRPRATDGLDRQRFDVMIWPETDGVYELMYRYPAIPNKLSEEAPYPYGGPIHAETIMASCMAVVEYRKTGQYGPAWDRFMTMLKASIAIDATTLDQELFGYNADAASGVYPRDRRGWESRHCDGNVTVMGVQY